MQRQQHRRGHAAALSVLLCSNWTLVFLEETPRLAWLAQVVRLLRPRWQRRWSETSTSHLNLISYCLGKPDGKDDEGGGQRVTRALAKVAEKLRVREIFSDFFIRRKRLSCRKRQGEEVSLLEFIFEGLREAAVNAKGMEYKYMMDTSNYRGQGVLVHDKELRISA